MGLYIHWPYCARICPYCDFNVLRDRGRAAEQVLLVQAIIDDLTSHAKVTGPRRLDTIFFGGGTPSLMKPEAVSRIIKVARGLWEVAPHLEVTLEANPADAEPERFTDLAVAGIERLSLGVQAFNNHALLFLGRDHDAECSRRALALANETFSRVSVDLIYALPGQAPSAWAAELEEVVASGCEHVSAYELSIEPGAAFHRAVRRGALLPAPDDLAADLYQVTQDVLGAAGFEAYEVSNHARGVRCRSRHNMIYWRGGDYIGVGPGAHGRLSIGDRRMATVTPDRVTDYVGRVRDHGIGSVWEKLDARNAAIERLVMGLRTTEGVALQDIALARPRAGAVKDLCDFLDLNGGRLTATPRGRLVLDRVVAELLRDVA